MPYPSEHAARVKDPGLFDPTSFRSKDLKSGVRLILGKLKGEDTMTAQAYRFSIEQFTEEEARKWLKDHKISFIKFEPAKKGESMEEKTLQHIGIMGMKWGHRKGSSDSSGPRRGIILRKGSKADQDFQESLYNLAKKGKGNDEKAVIKLAAKYDKAKAKEKVNKALQKIKKEEDAAKKRREDTLKEIERDVEVTRKSQGKKFNEQKHREMLSKFYAEDLNATPESMRKERRQQAATLTAAALMIVGHAVLNAYVDKKYGSGVKMPKKRVVNGIGLPARIPLDLKFN